MYDVGVYYILPRIYHVSFWLYAVLCHGYATAGCNILSLNTNMCATMITFQLYSRFDIGDLQRTDQCD